jgi:phenol 2-monooxygenase
VLEADGRWRIIAFSDSADPTGPSSAIRKLADFLERADASPIRRFTPRGSDIDAVIEVLVVFQQGYRDINLQDLPGFFYPAKGRYRLHDYEKLFCPNLDKGSDIFDDRGIDRDAGCILVVRPDQHVANVLPLDGFDALARFFDGFLIPQA